MALKLARAAFLAGDEATGRAVLDSLVSSKSKLTPFMLHTAAGIYDQYGMPGKAMDALNRAGDSVLLSEPSATYLAELKARAGDPEGAEKLYREVMAAYPEDTGASLGLAQLLAWNDRTQEAEGICRPILARDPGNRQARIILGRILTAAGRFEEAITEYRKALEKTP
jgi:tetratricopeptide (TPR) repeat protein